MNLFEKAQELTRKGQEFVLVTIVSCRGSSPQDPGGKAIVCKNGLEWGTVGGGKIEIAVIEKALLILGQKKKTHPEFITWNLQRDIGMTCGGEMSFLFEHHNTKNWQIVIFGAGHVSQALNRILEKMDCHVTCVDSRAQWLDKLPASTNKLCHPEPKEVVSRFSSECFFISMTQGHSFDTPILIAIAKNFPRVNYVGVIGSETKGRRIKKDLIENGVSEDFVHSLKVPIGLPLGNNNPYEISISIIAELIQVRDSIQSRGD